MASRQEKLFSWDFLRKVPFLEWLDIRKSQGGPEEVPRSHVWSGLVLLSQFAETIWKPLKIAPTIFPLINCTGWGGVVMPTIFCVLACLFSLG